MDDAYLSQDPAGRFLHRLAMQKGYIVSSASLSPKEVEQAHTDKRIYIDEHGLGYVWIAQDAIFAKALDWVLENAIQPAAQEHKAVDGCAMLRGIVDKLEQARDVPLPSVDG